ncbi:VOC family protein [Paenibacillus eucommiae]|uniref:Enzyme related to lactoylglutathione lyase n=1 Tax=Paenibacillus eucommiae TaxID=1355755 RepID=A0ABS4JB14_9BACL|nr:VOC family protein [Paenibacillus eucommiae]MBP1997032.1 putative enzyme related to lactoylglutathione lyase [Paenibacillus eucommiae]
MDQQLMTDQKKLLNDVVGVVSIYVRVSNIQRSVDWYSLNLGCEVKQQNDGYASVHLPWGATLDFWQDDNVVIQEYPIFCIYIKEINQYHKRLLMNGVSLTEIDDQGDCGYVFKVFDPDGHVLDVWSGYKGEGTGVTEKFLSRNK